MKIGFFDSGIGGISVLHQAMQKLPDEGFLYYADTRHVPYGLRTREEIRGYVETAVRFLIGEGAGVIVLACNTATSAAIDGLRSRYALPILGMEPAVKPAVAHCGEKRVLVAATPVTIQGERLHHLMDRVDDRHLVDLLPLPQLVVFAERGEFESDAVRNYLKKELSAFRLSDYGELVLGCTHFNYFRKMFREIVGPAIHFADGCEGTVRHLIEVLDEKGLRGHEGGSVRYFKSGLPVTDAKSLAFFQRLNEQLDAQYDV